MANNNARPSTKPQPQQPFADHAPKPQIVAMYDIPNEDGLWSERTQDFGSIRSIGMRLLSPLQEKHCAARAKGDTLQLPYELGRASIAEVSNENGDVFAIQAHDGTMDMLWAQIHPKIRTLVVEAYAENAVPNGATSSSFLASRKLRA